MLHHNAQKEIISVKPAFTWKMATEHYQHIGKKWRQTDGKYVAVPERFNFHHVYPQVIHTILDSMSIRDKDILWRNLYETVEETDLTEEQARRYFEKGLPEVSPHNGTTIDTWRHVAYFVRTIIRFYSPALSDFQFHKVQHKTRASMKAKLKKEVRYSAIRANKFKQWLRTMFLLRWFTIEEYLAITKEDKDYELPAEVACIPYVQARLEEYQSISAQNTQNVQDVQENKENVQDVQENVNLNAEVNIAREHFAVQQNTEAQQNPTNTETIPQTTQTVTIHQIIHKVPTLGRQIQDFIILNNSQQHHSHHILTTITIKGN